MTHNRDKALALAALRHARELRSAARMLLGAIRVRPESRWPCFECGRPNRDAPLRTLHTRVLEPAVPQGFTTALHGCWTCNADSKIEALNDACDAIDETHCAVLGAELAEPPREPWRPFAEPAPGLEDAARAAAEASPLVRALRNVAEMHVRSANAPHRNPDLCQIDACIADALETLAEQLEPEETNG